MSEALDQEIEAGDEMLVTRKLFASGRSSLSVNGPADDGGDDAGRAAERLVDIHGQHDHQFLLKPANQLAHAGRISPAAATTCGSGTTSCYGELRRPAAAAQGRSWTRPSTLRKQQLELYASSRPTRSTPPTRSPASCRSLEARETGAGEPAARSSVTPRPDTHYAALYEAEGSACERLQAITHLLLDLAELDGGLDRRGRAGADPRR